MIFAIKQFEQRSAVITHTLRFYDKIGLLKPAHYGDN